jgi:hypothetical protein
MEAGMPKRREARVELIGSDWILAVALVIHRFRSAFFDDTPSPARFVYAAARIAATF